MKNKIVLCTIFVYAFHFIVITTELMG